MLWSYSGNVANTATRLRCCSTSHKPPIQNGNSQGKTTDATTIVGVLSERDVMTGLAAHGGDALDRTVADLMTTQVVTCQPDTTVEQLMATMTELRVRHVPVVVDGELAGVVSIGDVVKDRISVLEHETEALHNYISNPY